MQDKDKIRKALSILSGFLSSRNMEEIALRVKEAERAGSQLGTGAQAEAVSSTQETLHRIVDSMSPYHQREVLTRLNDVFND